MIGAAQASLVRRGCAHLFGDDVPLDDGIMAFRFAIERVVDPDALIPHLFEQVDPAFASSVKRGDLVLAGANFGWGKPHVQGYIAMAALGLSILCVSMPHKALRRAVAAGLPVITGIADPRQLAQAGDEIEVDFGVGLLRNLTRQTETSVPPMPAILREIVSAGGAEGALAAWLRDHPEQALAPRET